MIPFELRFLESANYTLVFPIAVGCHSLFFLLRLCKRCPYRLHMYTWFERIYVYFDTVLAWILFLGISTCLSHLLIFFFSSCLYCFLQSFHFLSIVSLNKLLSLPFKTPHSSFLFEIFASVPSPITNICYVFLLLI